MSETETGNMASQASERRGHDVFISYSREDKATAEAVCAALETAGIPCWIGPRDTQAGAYGRSIMEAIRTARMLVLVLSPHADRTPNVLTEVAEAFDRNLALLPFRLANFTASDSMRFYIRTQHWIDAFPGPPEQYLGSLVERVRKRLAQIEKGEPVSGEQARAKNPEPSPPAAAAGDQHKSAPPPASAPGAAATAQKAVPPAPKRHHTWAWLLASFLVLAAVVGGTVIGVNTGVFDGGRSEALRGEHVDMAPARGTDGSDEPNCRAGDCWGSIAIGAGGVWASAVNYTTKEEASTAAGRKCGGRCTHALNFYNSCGAYATGNTSYGWGQAKDRAGAERMAMQECRARGPGCATRAAVCTR